MAGETPGKANVQQRRAARRKRFEAATNPDPYKSGDISALNGTRGGDVRQPATRPAKERPVGTAPEQDTSTDRYYRSGGSQYNDVRRSARQTAKQGKPQNPPTISPESEVVITGVDDFQTGVLAVIAAVQGGEASGTIHVADGERKQEIMRRTRAFLDVRKAAGDLTDEQYYRIRFAFVPVSPTMPKPTAAAEAVDPLTLDMPPAEDLPDAPPLEAVTPEIPAPDPEIQVATEPAHLTEASQVEAEDDNDFEVPAPQPALEVAPAETPDVEETTTRRRRKK